MSKKQDLLKAAEEISDPQNIRKPIIEIKTPIVDNVDKDNIVTQDTESLDNVDKVFNEIKAEKLPSGLKVTTLLKFLNEKEDRITDERISAWIPTEMLTSLNRIIFKLQDIAIRRHKKTRIGISTVLKILIAESATRVESFIDKERQELIDETKQ